MKVFSPTSTLAAAGLLCGFFMSSSAWANTVTGSIYEGQFSGAANAQPSSVPTSPANVVFTTTTPINFSSNGTDYTIGSFLSSGNGSTIVSGSGELGNTLDNTLFNFTGMVDVTNGETFTVGHDDGLTLVIDGMTVINAPGPTSFQNTTQTYTGPSGTFAFQLVYGETAGAPADLSINLPLTTAVTPEPSSLLLLGTGVLGMGAMVRRRMLA